MKPSKKTLGWLTFLLFTFVFFVAFSEEFSEGAGGYVVGVMSLIPLLFSILFFVLYKILQVKKTPYRKIQTASLLLATFSLSGSIGIVGLLQIKYQSLEFTYFVITGLLLALILFIAYLFRKEDPK